MAKTAIKVNCILNGDNAHARILVMQTYDNPISFPIIIAAHEADCILKELEEVKVKRPQTHDLFFGFMQAFAIHLDEVYIYRVSEGIFYTKLICSTNGKTIELDSRPSDALILALKADAPVFVESDIVETLGIPAINIELQLQINKITSLEAEEENELEENDELEDMSNNDLMKMLKDAIETEEFEIASQIRDILNQRKDPLNEPF